MAIQSERSGTEAAPAKSRIPRSGTKLRIHPNFSWFSRSQHRKSWSRSPSKRILCGIVTHGPKNRVDFLPTEATVLTGVRPRNRVENDPESLPQ